MNSILEITVVVILVTSGVLESVGGVIIVLLGTLVWYTLNKLAGTSVREELVTHVREELVSDKLNRSMTLIDLNIRDDIHKRHEFRQKMILADESLTNNEKTFGIGILNKILDRGNIMYNMGTKRICEN